MLDLPFGNESFDVIVEKGTMVIFQHMMALNVNILLDTS